MKATIAGSVVQGKCCLLRATNTGACLTVHLSTVNGTGMGAQEWCDAIFLQYGLYPPDLPNYCDGCNIKFTICNAPNCNRGGIVRERHNELQR